MQGHEVNCHVTLITNSLKGIDIAPAIIISAIIHEQIV
jgi:hypothetical protein